ncbi:MAG: cadherin-like domain-containing protein [Pirellulaceae bacterium]
MRYIPDGDNGETATFVYQAWDRTAGTASTNVLASYGDASINGGTTAFSSNSSTAQIVVTSVNDAPVDFVASGPGANLVTNGSFESGAIGWTFTGSAGVGTGYAPTDGTNHVTFSGGDSPNTGIVSQSLATTIGQTYTVMFDFGAHSAFGITQAIRVEAVGGVSLYDETLASFGTDPADYRTFGFTFVADSTSTLIRFSDVSSETIAVDSTLDNVRVYADTPTVVENSVGGTIVSYLAAQEIDSNDDVTFAIVGGDSANFEIVGNELRVRAGADIDYESGTTRTVTVRATDESSATFDKVVTINITDVNDVPVNTVPGAQTVDEDTAINITGISVADQDDNLSTVQLSVANGTVNVTLAGGASISAGANDSNDLTLSGTLTDINATLASLTYQGNLNFNGVDTLTVLSTDSDSATASDTIAITVGAVNDTPSVTGPGSAYSATEQTNLNIHGTGFSITDVDAASGTMTATIVVGEGVVTITAGDSGVTISSGNGTGNVVITGTLAQIDNLLTGSGSGTIIYFNGNDAPSASTTITLTLNDGGNTGTDPGLTGNGSSEEDSVLQTINIIPTNDIPLVNMSPGGETYVENASPEIVDATVTVTDSDSLDFDGGVLTVSLDLNGTANDRLTVLHEGIGLGEVNVVGNTILIDGTQIATFIGGIGGGDDLMITFDSDAFAADVEKVARRVAFSNTSDNPSDSIRVVGMQVSDGDGLTSLADQRVVYLTAVNDEQVLAINSGTTVAEGSTGTVIATAMLHTTDVDNTDIQLVYTVNTIPAHGTLRLSGAALSNGQTFTQDDIDNNRVTYDHDGSQTSADSFAFTVDDGVGTTTSGTFNLTITNVNDAPVNTMPGDQSVNEDTPLAIAGVSVADDDNNLSTVQLSVSNGTLNVTLSGTASIAAGTNGSNDLTLSGSLADINATLASLTYQGNLNFNGSDTLTVLSTDSNAATDSDTLNITVGAVNDTPNVVAPGSAYTVNEQTNLNIHGTGFSVSDVDAAAGTMTATIAVGEGSITVAEGDSGVTISAGNGSGTVTLTGTLAQIDNLLTGSGTGTIVYHNGSDTPSASTTLTVTVNDGGNTGTDPGLTGDGSSEVDSASQTINITAVNDEEVLATNTG